MFRRAKELHDKNILFGKVAKGNFGKYLNACFDNRLKKFDEAARLQREEAYYSSPEFQKKLADDQKAAETDPLHRYFTPSPEAVLARVQFDTDPHKNIRAWDRFTKAFHKLVWAFVREKNLDIQREVDLSGTIRHEILKNALSVLNGYYQQPILASSEEFVTEINAAIPKVAPGMQLLQIVAPVIDNSTVNK
jgi:hypothetical protein